MTTTQDVSMSADASYMFVHGSVTAEHGQEDSHQQRSSKSKKTTRMQYLGDQPDPVTGIIPRSTNPALIEKKIQPICHLLKSKNLRRECFKFIRSKAFCFTGLPTVAKSQMEGQEEMLTSLFKMKTFGRCGSVGLPLLGWKSNPNQTYPSQAALSRVNKEAVFKYHSHHEWDQVSCMAACAQETNCVLASAYNGGCQHCLAVVTPAKTVGLFKLKKDYRGKAYQKSGMCEKRFGDARLGITARWVDDPNEENVEICTAFVPESFNTAHCFESLQPSESYNPAYTHVFLTGQIPRLPERDLKFSASVGIPLFEKDKVVGDKLGSQLFIQEVPYGKAEELFEYMASFMRNVGYGENFDPGIVNNITLAVAKTCSRYCMQIKNCDSMSVQLIPPNKVFFDFLLLQRQSGFVLVQNDKQVESLIDSKTSDSFRHIFAEFNSSKLWKNESYEGLVNPEWDADQFLEATWDFYRDYASTKEDKETIRKGLIDKLRGKDMKTVQGYSRYISEKMMGQVLEFSKDHMDFWERFAKSAGTEVNPEFRNYVNSNDPTKTIVQKYFDKSEHKTMKEEMEKVNRLKDAYSHDIYQMPMRPWFHKMSPLRLSLTCEFHQMKDIVLLGGSHEECNSGSVNKDCNMQVGQFFSSDAFQVYGHDLFQDKWQ